jgi:hypothetical protein
MGNGYVPVVYLQKSYKYAWQYNTITARGDIVVEKEVIYVHQLEVLHKTVPLFADNG